MKKSKHLLILSLLNICFIVYLTFSGSKYAINLMEYDEAYSKLIQIDGVGNINKYIQLFDKEKPNDK